MFCHSILNFNTVPSLRLSHVRGHFKTPTSVYTNINLRGLFLPSVLMKQDRSGNGASLPVL